MSNVKISALPAAGALDGTEEVPAVQGGVTVKTTTQDIANLGSGVSYLVYTYLFQQAGTLAPNPIILQNTIGEIIWTRQGVGQYFATLAGAFPHDKTWMSQVSDFNGNGYILIPLSDAGSIIGYMGISWGNTDRIGIDVFDPSFVRSDWSTIMDVSNIGLEIRVYP